MVVTTPNGDGDGPSSSSEKDPHSDRSNTKSLNFLTRRFSKLLPKRKNPSREGGTAEHTANGNNDGPAAIHSQNNVNSPPPVFDHQDNANANESSSQPYRAYLHAHSHTASNSSSLSFGSADKTLEQVMARSRNPNRDPLEEEVAVLHYGGGPSPVLHRSLHHEPHKVVSAQGLYMHLSNGQTILDATGGAAVSCLGHGNERVKAAMAKQMDAVSYCHSLFFGTQVAEELAYRLCDSTEWMMRKAFIVCSGSEAMEAAVKMARQYFVEIGETQRTRFVARRESYHGITLGALAVSGHVGRRAIYEPLLMGNVSMVSACNVYRGMLEGETEEAYVERLKQELDEEFQRLGPETVCAFVAEPVVGAALGCVPAVPGYFKAMKEVCDKYGALLILDEIMCGIGRTGRMHAWQHEGVAPDIQTIGKGIGGGYAPVAGILINKRVVEALNKGTGAFSHGQTYQGHPVGCAAALEVQKVLNDENLFANVRKQGAILEELLKKSLGAHPHVGDIRGKGLFWGIEFVKDKATKEPFEPQQAVAMRVHEKGMEEPYSISLYPGTGTVDGKCGDHVLISPAYTVKEEEISLIVQKVTKVIDDFFKSAEFAAGNGAAWTHP